MDPGLEEGTFTFPKLPDAAGLSWSQAVGTQGLEIRATDLALLLDGPATPVFWNIDKSESGLWSDVAPQPVEACTRRCCGEVQTRGSSERRVRRKIAFNCADGCLLIQLSCRSGLAGSCAVPGPQGKVAKNASRKPGCYGDGLIAALLNDGRVGARRLRGSRALGVAVAGVALEGRAAARHGGDRKACPRRVVADRAGRQRRGEIA